MKFLFSVFLLLAVSVVTVYSVPKCPPKGILDRNKTSGCKCLDTTLTMSCDNIDHEWLKNFRPTELFELNTLEIKNSPQLPFMSDKFHDIKEHTGIKAQTVIFTLKSVANIQNHIMDDLLNIATEEIKITLKDNGPFVIQAPKFPISLTSLTLENVKITKSTGSIFENLNLLDKLQLKKVSFDNIEEKLVIRNPTRVDITNSKTLTKKLQYIPKSACTGDEIVLNLQNNEGLDDLDISGMFPDAKCKYYVDLSGTTINENFLKNKEKFLADKVKTPGQIFLIMRETTPLKCDKCVRKWYDLMPDYVHSVLCVGKDADKTKWKYIDQMSDADLDAC